MGALKLLLAVAVAVLVHLAGQQTISGFSLAVDVFLIVVVLHGLGGNSLSAMLVGFLIGLLHDTLTNGPFGLFGFADTIVGYGTARLAQRLVIQRPSGVLGVVAFAAVVQQAILAVLAFLLLSNPALPDPVWVVVKAAACGVLGMAAYVLSRRWRRGAEARRRSRMSRLRLD
jgi:rod shape-determining protein MreD